MVVEGWQGGGEYFGGKIGPWGGRKRLDRWWRQGARRKRGRRARRESRGAKNANSQTCKLLKSPPLNLIFYN